MFVIIRIWSERAMLESTGYWYGGQLVNIADSLEFSRSVLNALFH